MTTDKARRVCHFSTVHKPFDVRIFHREARSLAAAGYEVVLLTHASFRKKFVHGVHLLGLPIPKRRWQRLCRTIDFFTGCIRIGADIFHFHDIELLPIAYLLKSFTKAKVIYDCHENYAEAVYERAWCPTILKPMISWFITKMEPFLACRLDAVICVVPEQEMRFKVCGCRTVMIHNFPRLAIFNKSEYGNIAKKDQLIYLGGLSLTHGTKLLVDIMAELRHHYPQTRLLCLGSFNEPFIKKEVYEYVNQKAVADIIEFHPVVPHDKVPLYLHQSRLALLPWQANPQTMVTCYPNKVFEYWACSLPIIASDLPGLRRLLHDSGAAILVKSDLPQSFVAAICSLLKNPQKSAMMGKTGYRVVREQYQWEKEEKKLLELYRNLSILKYTDSM